MNLIEAIAVEKARRAATFAYAAAHDRLAELEQIEMLKGHVYEAAGARRMADAVLAAWLKEQEDPRPDGLA